MTVANEELNAIKRNSAVLRIYGNKVKLEKRGKEYFGRCPFHAEKTGSFSINQRQGFWLYHCFGCGESGSIIDFVQKTDNLSFPQAIESIRQQIGSNTWEKEKAQVEQVFKPIEEEDREYKEYTPEQYAKLEAVFDKTQAARDWLLKERGITYETAKKLRFGFRQDIGKIAGPPNKEIANKGWISFPCFEGDKVVSIKYRSIVRKAFSRQPGMKTTLFNLDTVDIFEPVILSEGEFDASILEQAGFRCVSLPNAGFKLTPEHRDLLLQAESIILAGDNDGAAGTKAMDRLKADFGERSTLIKWPEGYKDANEVFIKHCKRDVDKFRELLYSLIKEAKSQPLPGVYSLVDIMGSPQEEVLVDHPDRFRFPWKNVDEMAILMPGSVAFSTATSTGMGKALANGTKVLTPNGYVEIQNLKVGDYVVGKNGTPVVINGVFPQGIKNALKMTFSDGSTTICCDEHLWAVQNHWDRYKKYPFRIMTSTALAEKGVRRYKAGFYYSIPTVKPVIFAVQKEDDPHIHPYIMGCLLGDGSLCGSSIQFTSKDEEIVENIKRLLPPEMEISKNKGNEIQYIIKRKTEKHLYWRYLEKVGLRGTKSETKFIPDIYKLGSIETRTQILQGLLDTDGCATKNNGVYFHTASKQLMEDVLFIVNSLGGTNGKVNYRRRSTKISPEYSVRILLNNGFEYFKLPRKQNRLRLRTKRVIPTKFITDIEKVEKTEMTCISVGSEDGLFVIDGFVVTHNTVWWLNATLHCARKHKEVVLNYQVELTPNEISNIVAAHVLAKDRNSLTKDDYNKAATLLKGVRYYIGADTTLTEAPPVLDLIEAAVKRLGATVVVLDHIHFICRGDDDIREQAKAMQRIKNMARTYGLKFIVIGQPRKAEQKNKGKSLHISDAKGSETLTADSDVAYFIHREVQKNIDPSNPPMDEYEPETEVHLKKVRSKGRGAAFAKLYFEGRISTFLELSPIEENQ